MTVHLSRSRYVYCLEIEYPEGSKVKGWEPKGYSDPMEVNGLNILKHYYPFKWPRERVFLTATAAAVRAQTLTHYGAKVTVYRSRPVEWQEQPYAVGEPGENIEFTTEQAVLKI